MAKKKVFKISDEEIKRMYLEGNSLNDIAKVAQDTKGLMALRQRLIDLGVNTKVSQKKYRYKISKCSRKYTFNEYYFNIIDNEHKAYWLGFLMADGYNHESKNCVAIRLQLEDKEILEKFKKELNYTGPIYEFHRITAANKLNRSYCELCLCSPIFSESLSNIGCIQGKTYLLQFPNLRTDLIQHFIRGYFDGDGCLSITPRRNRTPNSKCYQFNITGKVEVIQVIQNYLCNACQITKTTIAGSSKNFAKRIHWAGKNVVTKIMNYLYQNSTIYLKRKHDKYLELIGNSAE